MGEAVELFNKVISFCLVWLYLWSVAACGYRSPNVGEGGDGILATQTMISPPRQEENAMLLPTQIVQTPITSLETPIPEGKIAESDKVAAGFEVCSPLEPNNLQELPEIISAPYDPPPPGREERHHGVDFSYYRRGDRTSILGATVQAVLAGKVAAALEDEFPYGNMVILETTAESLPVSLHDQLGFNSGESLYLLSAHFGEEPLVTLGDTVAACQPLGVVGKSGNAGVAHLHIEARIGPANSQFTEMAYYLAQTTELARENYELWRTSGVFRHFDPMVLLAFGLENSVSAGQASP